MRECEESKLCLVIRTIVIGNIRGGTDLGERIGREMMGKSTRFLSKLFGFSLWQFRKTFDKVTR